MENDIKFGHIGVGDRVTRMLAGSIPMKLIVGKVDDDFIYTASPDGIISHEEGWKFRKDNGSEVDEDLGWDGIKTTGSFLIRE
jgi:hypothetical protein